MVANATKNAEQDVKALSDQIDKLRADLSNLTELVTDIGSRRGSEAVDQVNERIHHLRDQAGQARDSVKEQALSAERQAIEAVREQPGMALGVAVGLGFLAGLVLGRR